MRSTYFVIFLLCAVYCALPYKIFDRENNQQQNIIRVLYLMNLYELTMCTVRPGRKDHTSEDHVVKTRSRCQMDIATAAIGVFESIAVLWIC